LNSIKEDVSIKGFRYELLKKISPKEDAQKIVYDCKVFPYSNSTTEITFATIVERTVHVYCFQTSKPYEVQEILTIVDDHINEIYYCLEWTVFLKEKKYIPILMVGGSCAIIKVYNCDLNLEHCHLQGHLNDIYDIKTHPQNCDIILSASKDHSIRLWNAFLGRQLAIFHGPNGHLAEVISIGWHDNGKSFVSSGMDYSIRFWRLDDKLIPDMNKPGLEKPKVKFIYFPAFSTDDIHDNFVDCCAMIGNLILSKSVYGDLSLWRPNKDIYDKCTTIVKQFTYNNHSIMWYVRFSVNPECNIVAVSNTNGEIFIFDIFAQQKLLTGSALQIIKTNSSHVCRSISFSKDSKFLICANDIGEMFIYIRKEEWKGS
jgi:polycomb protein EED